jgi:hypothetical protein
MHINGQRFTTKARTWLFIAALTALLIGVGALIGGIFLYVFVALAVATNVVGYWFSDRLALKASGAKPVEPGTNPELEAMAQDLAQRAKVPVPRLYTIPSEQPNAFATGRNPEHAAVAVTDGLLQQLPAEQVKSVLAHEFGHIKNRDILVFSIAAMVAGAIAAIANLLQFSLLFGGDEDDTGALGWIGLIGLGALVRPAHDDGWVGRRPGRLLPEDVERRTLPQRLIPSGRSPVGPAAVAEEARAVRAQGREAALQGDQGAGRQGDSASGRRTSGLPPAVLQPGRSDAAGE